MRGEMCASKRVKPIKWYIYFFIFYSSPFWFWTGLYDKTTARGAFSKTKRFGTFRSKYAFKKTTFVSDTYNKESSWLFSWHFYLQHLTIEVALGDYRGTYSQYPYLPVDVRLGLLFCLHQGRWQHTQQWTVRALSQSIHVLSLTTRIRKTWPQLTSISSLAH